VIAIDLLDGGRGEQEVKHAGLIVWFIHDWMRVLIGLKE